MVEEAVVVARRRGTNSHVVEYVKVYAEGTVHTLYCVLTDAPLMAGSAEDTTEPSDAKEKRSPAWRLCGAVVYTVGDGARPGMALTVSAFAVLVRGEIEACVAAFKGYVTVKSVPALQAVTVSAAVKACRLGPMLQTTYMTPTVGPVRDPRLEKKTASRPRRTWPWRVAASASKMTMESWPGRCW